MAERPETTRTTRRPPTTPPMPETRDQDRREDTPGSTQLAHVGAQVRDWAAEAGGQIKSGAQAAMDQVSSSASQLSEQGRAAAVRLEKTLGDTIRERPLPALLVAAGVGVMLGLLMRR